MQDLILEVCVDSVESAIAAVKGGADRLELCSNLIIGGTTPGIPLYREIRKHTDIPVRVLIRPRFGDFLYSAYEYEIIKQEIHMFKEEGADGIVTGFLTCDGNLDINRITEVLTLAANMKLTFHRAFDLVKDPMEALEQLKELGIDSILTSGQKNTCLEGMEAISSFIQKSEDKLNIVAGAGITPYAIQELLTKTPITQFHMSGKKSMDSNMRYRKDGVHMGMKEFSEYSIIKTDMELIQKSKQLLIQKKKESMT